MRIGVVGLPLLLASCATGSPTTTASRPDQTVRVVSDVGTTTAIRTTSDVAARVDTVDRTIASVWGDLPAAYQSLGIEIGLRDADEMIIGNPAIRVRRNLGNVRLSRMLDCGRSQDGPNADTYEVTLTVMTRLTPGEQGGTVVTTTVSATARPIQFAGGAVSCSSRGDLEDRILIALVVPSAGA